MFRELMFLGAGVEIGCGGEAGINGGMFCVERKPACEKCVQENCRYRRLVLVMVSEERWEMVERRSDRCILSNVGQGSRE